MTGLALIDAAMVRRQPGMGLIPAESVFKMTTLSTAFRKIFATFDTASQHSRHDIPRNHSNKSEYRPCNAHFEKFLRRLADFCNAAKRPDWAVFTAQPASRCDRLGAVRIDNVALSSD
ncbi:hypothetical protein [Rhodanobacter sp. C01]|uniref:hypothetical protein n=1 Tax=Rhodanobacter sp. C01 TaxID=1945856 RepID=UPI0011156B82|nr:hypothetical protein [Rhodanobacter sp. C01]